MPPKAVVCRCSAIWRPAILLKRDSYTGDFLWKLRNFQEHLWWLLLCLVDSYSVTKFFEYKSFTLIFGSKNVGNVFILRSHCEFGVGIDFIYLIKDIILTAKIGIHWNSAKQVFLPKWKEATFLIEYYEWTALCHTDQSYLHIIGIELILKKW